MKYWWILLLLLVACTPRITNVLQAYEEVQLLDGTYNTNFREEMTNRLFLGVSEIDSYLADLDELRSRVTADGKEAKWIEWFFSAREQMLLSQKAFQQGWFGIGEEGRVSNGFSCSEIDKIREETLLLEEAWSVGFNATRVFDAIMTENDDMRQLIGIGENKPKFYLSDLEGLYIEIQSNVVGMEQYCNLDVPTAKLNFEVEDEGT
ncbi:hypothetical protein ACFL1B_03030 [Nanoarchaeota archaeon]